jgi:NCS1 nucleoside transporter family
VINHTDADEIQLEEDSLSTRYHQPRRVEQFGVEAIPPELKMVRWYDLFFIVINFLINPATILTAGMAVAAGLSFQAAVLAQTLGALIAFSAYLAMATIGVDYGLPGQVATRMTFGLSGSRWLTSLPRSIASVYWFAFQAIAGSIVIVGVLHRWRPGNYSLVLVSIVFCLMQVLVAVIGYDSLKVLSRIAFPIKISLLVAIIIAMMRYPDPNYDLHHVLHYSGRAGWSWPLFAVWLNGMAASWLTMITDAADFCRYSRSRTDMWAGTLSAALMGTVMASFIGAYGAAATLGLTANTFEVVIRITSSHSMLLAVVVLIVLENWTINVLNLYTGGLSLTNMFPKIGRFWTTLVIGVAGVFLSARPGLVHGYVRYTTALGNLFAPIAGVLLADYLFVKRGRVQTSSLFTEHGPYWYWHGFNPVAAAWIVFGLGIYFWIPPTLVQSLSALALTATGYLATMRLLMNRFPSLACHPPETSSVPMPSVH